jgi:predicted kinase
MELIILMGLPASGKTSFYWTQLSGEREYISKDLMPNVRRKQEKQIALLERALKAGRSVVVDNTNSSRAMRAPLLALGRDYRARVVGYYFESSLHECLERNRQRIGKARVPDAAIFSAAKLFEIPSQEEGFDELYSVTLSNGTDFNIKTMLTPVAGLAHEDLS